MHGRKRTAVGDVKRRSVGTDFVVRPLRRVSRVGSSYARRSSALNFRRKLAETWMGMRRRSNP
jgi:hypothetical protein